MPADRHISMDACIQIDSTCPVAVQVVGDQAEVILGTGHVLSIIFDEVSLARLASVATEASDRLQAIPDGFEVDFTVTAKHELSASDHCGLADAFRTNRSSGQKVSPSDS